MKKSAIRALIADPKFDPIPYLEDAIALYINNNVDSLCKNEIVLQYVINGYDTENEMRSVILKLYEAKNFEKLKQLSITILEYSDLHDTWKHRNNTEAVLKLLKSGELLKEQYGQDILTAATKSKFSFSNLSEINYHKLTQEQIINIFNNWKYDKNDVLKNLISQLNDENAIKITQSTNFNDFIIADCKRLYKITKTKNVDDYKYVPCDLFDFLKSIINKLNLTDLKFFSSKIFEYDLKIIYKELPSKMSNYKDDSSVFITQFTCNCGNICSSQPGFTLHRKSSKNELCKEFSIYETITNRIATLKTKLYMENFMHEKSKRE